LSNVIFICNGNADTGFGHVSRCLNIALAMHEIDSSLCILFCGNYNEFSKQVLLENNVNIIQSLAECMSDDVPLLLVDDYQVTENVLKDFKRIGCHLAVIDDFDKFGFDCVDLVINFRFEAERFVSKSTKNLLGISYFPFNLSLIPVRERRYATALEDTSIRRILVFIGAVDINQCAPVLLECLDQAIAGVEIVWLTQSERTVILENNHLQKIPFVTNMAKLYASVDAVICGGGLTKYEAGYCILPTAAISQTHEQSQDSHVLASRDLCFDLGMAYPLEPEILLKKLNLFFRFDNLNAQVTAMRMKYNSRSTHEVAKQIVSLMRD
jgi:spore coat polysaccharide biosynthesis predicted glycosyltransferase SpsG